jgi:hypothetical protein
MRTILWMMVLGVAMVACEGPLREECGRGLSGSSVEDVDQRLESAYVEEYRAGEGGDEVWYATSFFEGKWCNPNDGVCGGDPPICTCETYHDAESGDDLVRECQLFLNDGDALDYVTYLEELVADTGGG